MHLDWLIASDPVAIWWDFLVLISAGNIALLVSLWRRFRQTGLARRAPLLGLQPLLLLSAAYVLGCAFRSILPRADVQRICLFDTWLSSIMVGRSVATVAELCFILQWAIVLRTLARLTAAESVRNIAHAIVPLIAIAEFCSWYAVVTTDYLGNVLENSLWTAAFLLIAAALVDLAGRFRSVVRLAIIAAVAGIGGYALFMCTVDLPMYFVRWQAQLTSGKEFFGLASGLHDVATRWIVTRDFTRWKGEIAWMSLYFSAAVWTSLLLASFRLVMRVPARYLATPPQLKRRETPLTMRDR
jgi:hypothetical protein